MSAVDRVLAARLGKFLVVGGTGVVLNNAALYVLYQVCFASRWCAHLARSAS
jgi:putative flippase GtrA